MRDIKQANRVVVYVQGQENLDTLPACFSCLTAINLSAFGFGFHDGFPSVLLNGQQLRDSSFEITWQLLDRARHAGVKVLAVLGGVHTGEGTYTALFNDYDTLYPLWRAMLRGYQFDGVDLDIGEVVAQDDLERLVFDLRSDFSPDFLITAAPVAEALLTGFDPLSLVAWLPLARSIDWFNVQFYRGYGSLADSADYDAIIAAGFDSRQILGGALTNPCNGRGYVPIADVCSTLRLLAIKYAGRAGGAMGRQYGNANGLDEQVDPVAWANAMEDAVSGLQLGRRQS